MRRLIFAAKSHRRSGNAVLFFIGSIVAAAGWVAKPGIGWAQCNTNTAPPPAANPPTSTFSNQSFGPSPPLLPYILTSKGAAGCDGAQGADGQSGGPGIVGQSAGQIIGLNTGLTIFGYPLVTSFNIGALVQAIGGNGGNGGFSGSVTNLFTNGGPAGNGGNGGNGGTITLGFNATFTSDANNPPANIGLYANASGGQGGSGGDTDPGGIYARDAGVGGAGGNAGQININVSGSIGAQTGVQALAQGGTGGTGGTAHTSDALDVLRGGNGGDGGNGGSVMATVSAATISATQYGLQAIADGGAAGAGGGTDASIETHGGIGGAGGTAGTASALVAPGGQITVTPGSVDNVSLASVFVTANGGGGGSGGLAGQALGSGGGSGGTGGTAGSASASILGSVAFNGLTGPGVANGLGVLVQSNGGTGGAGADTQAAFGSAGGGGFAGAGGAAALSIGDSTNTGTIETTGNFAHAAVVQSIGGGGGNGGNAQFSASGGAGAAGGNGGPVSVTSDKALVIAKGSNSDAVIAQSIGGGGGTGGDATDVTAVASLSIGGNGGLGGNGGAVQLNLGQNGIFASTNTLGGGGVLAQSIGGSGGNAGSAAATGGGLISLVIGGDAGGGGTGGAVAIESAALVTTYGDHAAGVQAQSIGGGGGKGGMATSFIVGALPTASIAVGGRGGGGGPAGDVSFTNTGQITTYGADAQGILMQSIGGGGGTGGAAVARAVALSPDKDIPAISISVATGGTGGSGNTAGQVTLDNSGLVTTAGDGAIGVMAQSIGGGGGNAGDSTAASYSSGAQAGLAISIAVAVGGTGGTGGTGNLVSLTNSGLIATLGQDAYGVFAQSIGGGGGTGGAGDATASANDAKGSFSASIAVGGGGGTGGDAGMVNLDNSGSILTRGDGAAGVFAQSIGGGGGAAGGGTATAAGNNLSISVGVGGSGGAGGNGNTVAVQNSGNVITRGTGAFALSVQSIGGGGGMAGKGGATAGGVSNLSNKQALFDILAGGLNANQPVTMVTDSVLQVGQIGENIKSSYDELNGFFSQPQAGNPEEGTATKINVAVSVGGSGGAAGVGGAVKATNTGSIGTFGAQSDGIFAQSVGGGGGVGGAASSTGSSSDDSQTQASVGLGGRSGAGGNGGPVTVVNGTGGTILTQGVLAFGIAAQSVGGGGGAGAIAGTVNGSLASLGVSIGGSGGATGDGGAVNVTTGDGTGDSTITTAGKHGIAIFAQSVGGGGGLVDSMTTNETFDPALLVYNPQGRIADVHGLSLTFGGQNGAAGNGGPVTVTASGPIITSGLDAHAIVAQSIGGGGGLAAGGQVTLATAGAGGGSGGDGGEVIIRLNPGTHMNTSGDGAYGILAQSIGGGGGTAGDLSTVDFNFSYLTGYAIRSNPGNGGLVGIVAHGADIITTGSYAPAIFAQSIGGGGGLIDTVSSPQPHALSLGTAGGAGAGGIVNVALVNSSVVAFGTGSAGIVAQSDGQSGSPIILSVDSASKVLGGSPDSQTSSNNPDTAAVLIFNGNKNQIVNSGTIQSFGDPARSYAIVAAGFQNNQTTITNSGTVAGNIAAVGDASIVLDNQIGGTVNAPVSINLGSGGMLNNAGTLQVGGVGTVGQTTIIGDLLQTRTGTLVVDLVAGANASDHLQINGRAILDGAVSVVLADPTNLHTGTRQTNILSATGGVVNTGTLSVASGTPVLHYDLATPTADTLNLAYTVDFSGLQALGAVGLSSANRADVGRALNAIFAGDGGALVPLAGQLAMLRDPQTLAAALDILSGEGVADVQQTVFATQQDYTSAVLHHVTTGGGGGGGDAASVGGASYAVAALGPVPGAPAAGDQDLRVWIAGFGGSDLLNATDGLASLHTQVGGGLVGVDRWFDPDLMVGFSTGGASSEFQIADRVTRGSTTSAHASVYGLARFGQVYLSSVLSYGNFATDLNRQQLANSNGLSASAHASLSSNVLGGQIEVGWRHPVGAVTFTPFAALEVDQLWQNPLTESSYLGTGQVSALSLHFASATQASVPLTLGGRVEGAFRPGGDRVLNLSAELGWVHEFDTQRSVTASFVAAPNFPFKASCV